MGINLGLVPKNNNGDVDYDAIKSMPVRILIIKEEILKLKRRRADPQRLHYIEKLRREWEHL